ncbi:MAG: transporter substrate-binding domain-containing protein [Cocleimonas sp.]|nr:transporter substrate-binding domain-containing protein [Cocleimonas sp.]
MVKSIPRPFGLFMFFCWLLVIAFLTLPSNAEESSMDESLKVAIKPSEPWVMYDENLPESERNPIGFSIDLWNEIASSLGRETEWVYQKTTPDVINITEDGEVDLGIAAITISSEREKRVDFSNSMYETGLQIMVSSANSNNNPLFVLMDELKKLLTWTVLGWLVVMLVVSSHIRLLVDRISTDNFFPRGYFKAIYEVLWWGITMLVTWETPQSKGLARAIDLSWHLIGLIAMSIMTAVVTAALTSQAIVGSIQSEKDLPGKRVAAVATDAPRKYLNKIGADVVPVKSIEEGMKLLREDKVEALVHDGPRLSYLAGKINKAEKKSIFLVIPAVFNAQNYGIVLPHDSPLREAINKTLLRLRETTGLKDSFHETLRKKWIPK